MKALKIPLLFLLFVIISLQCYSQIDIEKNSDGSVTLNKISTKIILDVDGNETTQQKQDDFLESNELYKRAIRFSGDSLIVYVERKYLEKEKIIGQKLPNQTYSDINGVKVDIVNGEKPCLLCFWDIHCGNCIVELNILNWIAWECPDLHIIGITPDKLSEVKRFMEDKNYKWNNITIVTDYKNDYFSLIQSKVHPTTLLIEKTGKIENVFYGGRIRPILSAIDLLLAK